MANQNARLKAAMRGGKWITPLDAWLHLGIERLAARIHELRAAGVNVRSRWVVVSGRHGKARVKAYRLG